MLGLGNSICANDYPGGWTPETPANLAVWLKFNTNITADENALASSVTHSTDAGNMADGDRINAWNAFDPTSINALQTTSADKPRWETDTADLGSLAFPAGIKFMDFSADTTIAANADFSIVLRFKPGDTSNRVLFGSSTEELLRIKDNKTFRLRIDNTVIDFAEASATIATDTYYTMILSRTNADTGDLNLYVNGGAFSDKDWDAAENATDAKNFVISNLGSSADDTGNFVGFMKDIIIYNGTALNASDRAELYTYIEAQE